jgi:hypothetical protein
MCDVTMIRFVWSKRKLMAAVVVCVILVAASIAFWQMNQGAQAAMVYPHPGLVGWWRFDEGSGTVASDSSGYGNNGTVYDALPVDGKYGKALSFPLNDGYVDLGDILRFETGDFSVSFWVKYTSGTWAFINKGYAFHGINGWGIAYENGVSVALQGRVGTPSNAPLTENVWNFVTVTFDRDGLGKTCINGVLKDSYDISDKQTISGTADPLYIGRYLGAMDFEGIIDEVRIYNRALSAAEIQADYQKSPDFSSKLLAKVPKGATQVITTLSWQGIGSINVTIQSPSTNYTEDILPVYQKTVYSTSDSTSSMLNIKRLSISVTALSSDENWYVMLAFDNVEDYRITVEVQK